MRKSRFTKQQIIGFLKKAELEGCLPRRQFQRVLTSYQSVTTSEGMGNYPETLEELLEDKRGLVTRRHLRKICVGPMTGRAEWGLVRVGGRIVGVHSLSDATPVKQSNFDVDFVGFESARSLRE